MTECRLAFVIPWFGWEIPGGAESYCRDLSSRLARRGYGVEILSTCARELASDWNVDHHRPGNRTERGVTVRRFRVQPGDHAAFNSLNERLLLGGSITADEERVFINNIINSRDLVSFIADHTDDYYFFFIPYMFGTTYWGLRAAGNRGILIPCLHDEPYARLDIMQNLFRDVRAMLFNSEPECRLANRLYDLSRCDQVVLGIGVEPHETKVRSLPIQDPFLLCLGRKDSGKNTGLLVRYFEIFKRHHPSPLKLVLAGPGSVPLCEDCIDLGFVDTGTKAALLENALAICQPSTNESFSKVIMEAWLAQTPAMVHRSCAVTRGHVQDSEGGLCFSDYYEFEACLEVLLHGSETANTLGKNGHEYVTRKYSWQALLDRFDEWFSEFRRNSNAETWSV